MEPTLSPKTAGPHHDDAAPLAPKDIAGAEDALAKLADAARAAARLHPRMVGSDFSAGPRVSAPTLDPLPPVLDLEQSVEPGILLEPHGRRAGRSVLRFLLAVAIGVAATLAWQSYGGAGRQMLATYVPALGLPSSDPSPSGATQQLPAAADESSAAVQANAADAAPAQPAAPAPYPPDPAAPPPSPELTQQIAAMARDLAAMRQSMEQFAAGHDQMARSIARLQAADEEARHRQLTPTPRPAPARTPQATLPPPRPTLQSSATPPPPRSVSQSSAPPPALTPPRPISQSSATPSPQPPRPTGSMP
jgi:hypothetical protein